jgi:hypothetical protein
MIREKTMGKKYIKANNPATFPAKKSGQGLVEFAIALPVLLLLIFGIIEFGRLVFSWLAVQNSARFAMRYAVTGDYDESYCDDAATALGSPFSEADIYNGDVADCKVPNDYPVPDDFVGNIDDIEAALVDWARLPSIQDAARAGGAGLWVDSGILGNYMTFLGSHSEDDLGEPDKRGYFHVTVCSRRDLNPPYTFDEYNHAIPLCKMTIDDSLMDNAGIPGERVIVVISYRHNMLLPFISTIWPDVPLDGRREGIVEHFRNRRISNTVGGFTPAATWTNTVAVPHTATHTQTLLISSPTSTPTITQTPANTSIPTCTDLSLQNFRTDDPKKVRVEVNNSSGTDVHLTGLAFEWLAFLAVTNQNNQAVERIDIGEPSNPSLTYQWASSVVSFSSEWLDAPQWGSEQALGAPNTSNCADVATAWAPLDGGSDLEFLHLGYSTPMYVTGVRIHETFESGFVVGVELVEPNGARHAIAVPEDNTACPGWFEIVVPETSYLVEGVVIYTSTNGWEEIDAVELIGYDSKPSGQIAVIEPSPSDVSPIIESTFAIMPSGVTDIIFNFKNNAGFDDTVIGDFGLYLAFTINEAPCVLEIPAENIPDPTATDAAQPTSAQTATPENLYDIVPGPNGEIWYRVAEGDGFAGDAWVKVEWYTNPDGSVTTRTTFSETFVDNTYDVVGCKDICKDAEGDGIEFEFKFPDKGMTIYNIYDFSVTLSSDGGADDLEITDYKVSKDKFEFTVYNKTASTINLNQVIFSYPVGNKVSQLKIKGDGVDEDISLNDSDGTLTQNLDIDVGPATAEYFACLTCQENSHAVGWGERGHTWRDLWHSDHVQIDFRALDDSTIFKGQIDYVAEDGSNGCVTDGDGEVEIGDASDMVSCDSSMTQNAQLACFDPTGPSPKVDENYIQDPSDPSHCPGWEFSVWYEATLSADAFDEFGYPLITYIHASPAKTADSKPEVVPGPTVAATLTLSPTPSMTLTPTNTVEPTNTPTYTPTVTTSPTNTLEPTPDCDPDHPAYPVCNTPTSTATP